MLESSMCMRPHFHDVVLLILTRVTIIIFFLDGSTGIPKRACMNLTKLEFVGQRKSPYQIISVRWHSHPNRLLAHFERLIWKGSFGEAHLERLIRRGSFGEAHSERLIWRRSFGEAHLEISFWMIICKEFLTQKRWCKSYYSLLSQRRISDFFTYRISENSFLSWIVSAVKTS